ncbi:hypothetical protein NCCP28_11290 [Niallia sp. NCCP-28]|nr:hypothetical protein NCCP28_11290 [Niallia sp. NCCP-28]
MQEKLKEAEKYIQLNLCCILLKEIAIQHINKQQIVYPLIQLKLLLE